MIYQFGNDLILKLWDEFPKVFFRFGVVLYTDTAVTSCIENCDTEKVEFQLLTKRKGTIKSFLSDSCYSKGGFDGLEDWASGYKYLLNTIEWDNNSEKIAIHIADAPAHGNSFIGINFYKIPMFNRTNSKSANQSQYSNIQEIEEEKLIKLIEKAATKGILFCCLNLNKYATNSFNVAKDLYMKKNGTEFIIQNHFKELDYDTLEDFVCNSVSSCFNKARRMRRLLIEKATNQNQNQQIKEDEEYDENDVEDGNEDDENDVEDGNEDEEYDENDVEDGNEDEDYDISEIKIVCNKDINTNTDKTQEECDDDDDVDTNDACDIQVATSHRTKCNCAKISKSSTF